MFRSVASSQTWAFLSHTHPIRAIAALMIPIFLCRSGCIYFLKRSSIDSLSWRGLTSQPVQTQVQFHTLTDLNSANGSYVFKDLIKGPDIKCEQIKTSTAFVFFLFLGLLREVDTILAAAYDLSFVLWMNSLRGHISCCRLTHSSAPSTLIPHPR